MMKKVARLEKGGKGKKGRVHKKHRRQDYCTAQSRLSASREGGLSAVPAANLHLQIENEENHMLATCGIMSYLHQAASPPLEIDRSKSVFKVSNTHMKRPLNGRAGSKLGFRDLRKLPRSAPLQHWRTWLNGLSSHHAHQSHFPKLCA